MMKFDYYEENNSSDNNNKKRKENPDPDLHLDLENI